MVLRLGVEVSRAEAYKLRPKAKKEGRHMIRKSGLWCRCRVLPPVQLVYRDGNLFP